MERPPIFTIGYGNRKIDEFLSVIQDYRIAFVIDVRSRPYSKYNPEFTQEYLARYLKSNAVRYVFMGDTLGGQPADSSCYTDGKVDYLKCREKTFFQEGIARLQTAWEKQIPVALMCSETKPHECHRSKLIGEALADLGITVIHLDERGKPKSQSEVIALLTKNRDQLSFLDNQFTSRKRYREDHDDHY